VCRPRESGQALLAAVSALAVMSALAFGLAETSALDARLAERSLAALQADALARSGVAVAAAVLAETGATGAPDTLAAPWAVDLGRQPLGAGWVRLQVEDEARRLDLGAPELADAVPRLLAVLGLDPALADALADWIDPDDVPRPRGAERDWYLGETPPRVPRNAPLATLGELGLVRGFDARVLTRVRPYVTVAGEHAVNPNTATREVLLAVVQDAPAVERLLAARARDALGTDDIAALVPDAPDAVRLVLTPRSSHYTVRAVGAVNAVRRSIEATVAAPAGVEPDVVAWRSFVP
jgi:general secretion pathway protein K